MDTNYIPSPMDTSDVQFPEYLQSLSERLAKNVHEHWAFSKISEGWCYGPTIDEVHKTHPCLVPYEMLGEEDKDYDRRTSTETIKMIISLGYKIIR